MFAFLDNWGNGELVALFVLAALVTIFIAGGLALESPVLVIAGMFCVLAALTAPGLMQDGREARLQSQEVSRILNRRDWQVSDAGSNPRVRIGDCLVDLRLVVLDGDNSLFAIGQEPQAQTLDVVFPRVIELCSK